MGLRTSSGRVFVGDFVGSKRAVAVSLLVNEDVRMLAPAFSSLWPVDETPSFGSLLQAIDEADHEHRRELAEGEPRVQSARRT